MGLNVVEVLQVLVLLCLGVVDLHLDHLVDFQLKLLIFRVCYLVGLGSF